MQCRAERFVNSRYSRYSSVSDMLDVLGWLPFSQRRYEARLIRFYKNINCWAKCPSNASLLRRIRVLEEIIRSGCNDSRLHVVEPPEEDPSSGKLESSQSCVSTLTHYSSELLLRRHQEL